MQSVLTQPHNWINLWTWGDWHLRKRMSFCSLLSWQAFNLFLFFVFFSAAQTVSGESRVKYVPLGLLLPSTWIVMGQSHVVGGQWGCGLLGLCTDQILVCVLVCGCCVNKWGNEWDWIQSVVCEKERDRDEMTGRLIESSCLQKRTLSLWNCIRSFSHWRHEIPVSCVNS